MNLINEKVIHKTFGEGNVVKYNDSYIIIKFKSGTKKFIFPDAFKRYIRLIDERATDLVGKKIQEKDEELKKEALRLQKERALIRERHQILEREKLMKNRKIHPELQAVFWCEAEEEDKIFAEWRVFVGEIKSGKKKGQPRRLSRINQNSACLLTKREPDMLEEDRRILGLFMVDEAFDGRLCEDGYIPAHREYRLRLSEDESKKMLFWNYYVNRRFPNMITWNSGRQRYFDNIWMAQILQDIISLKEEPQEREKAQLFFKYFCEINRINKDELPKANGTLMRV